MGGLQTDRSGAEQRDPVTWRHSRQDDAVPPGRKDVGQHREVILMLCARGQLEQVEVGERHPQHLGLPAVVGAMLAKP